MKKEYAEVSRQNIAEALAKIAAIRTETYRDIEAVKTSGKYTDEHKKRVERDLTEAMYKDIAPIAEKALADVDALNEHFSTAYDTPVSYKDKRFSEALAYIKEHGAAIRPEVADEIITDFQGNRNALHQLQRSFDENGAGAAALGAREAAKALNTGKNDLGQIGMELHMQMRGGGSDDNLRHVSGMVGGLEIPAPYTSGTGTPAAE